MSTADGFTPLPLEVDPATGQLQTSGSGGGGAGGATAVNQTNGLQLTQIVDNNGNNALVNGNALQVDVINGSLSNPIPIDGGNVNPVSVTGSFGTVDNGVSGTISNTGDLVNTNGLNGVSSVSILVTGTYTGDLSVQISVDDTTFTTLGGNSILNVSTGVVTAVIPSSTQSSFKVSVPSIAAIQVIALGSVTGTANVVVRAGTGAYAFNSANYLIGTGSNAQIKDDSFYGDGVGSGLLMTHSRLWNGASYDRMYSGGVLGMQGVSLQASPSGGWTPTNIATSTTTLVKSGAGTFHAAIINSLGTVSSTTSFYNNTTATGTPFAIINTLTLSGTFTYDIAFTVGLTVVTTGTIAPNVTVAWK